MKSLFCNKCGRKLNVEGGIPKEDFIQFSKQWGYFSKKDGSTQTFIVCEECMDEFEKEFVIPSTFSDTKELI